jgi:hypothetical protein
VNNRQIINQWVDQPPTTHRGTIALQAGQAHPIRLDYYENGGGAVARLAWSSARQAEQIVPASALRPPLPAARPPAVTILSPVAEQGFPAATAVTVVAEVQDPDADLVRVEFLADGRKLGEVTDAPFRWRWEAPPAGRHVLAVRAADAAGGITTAEVPVHVEALVLTWRPVVPGAQALQLRVAAADGRRFRLELSEDLVTWHEAAVATAAGGTAEFAQPIGAGHRFFRVVPLP